jgi:hypothetical protein
LQRLGPALGFTLDIMVKRLPIEVLLRVERCVKRRRRDAHGLGQVSYRGSLVSMFPKKPRRDFKRDIAI